MLQYKTNIKEVLSIPLSLVRDILSPKGLILPLSYLTIPLFSPRMSCVSTSPYVSVSLYVSHTFLKNPAHPEEAK